MPVLAILIALLSLVLSLYSSVSTRRAGQLQRLATIRTKLSNLLVSMRFDVSQYERYGKVLDRFIDHDDELTFEVHDSFDEDVAFLSDCLTQMSKWKQMLDSQSSKLSRFPLSLPVGEIDEIEHQLDILDHHIATVFERFLPRMLRLVEHMESASRRQ